MTKATDYGAANLYDGGWRADDKEQLMAEYDLTADEADEICAELLDIENRNTYEEAKDEQGFEAEPQNAPDDDAPEEAGDSLGYRKSGDRNSGNGNSGNGNSGYGNSGDRNSGDRNSGNGNSGSWNSGNWNSGYGNSGDGNSGHWNSGDWNSGDGNSGHWNSGDWNSGHWNSGDWNSGHWNSGDWNSGDWNATNSSSGCFNTREHTVLFFDKESDITLTEWRKTRAWELLILIDFSPTTWINERDMSEEEKESNYDWKVRGGYLKVNNRTEAFVKWWSKLSPEDRDEIKSIPNFDAKKFYKITGLDVEKETKS